MYPSENRRPKASPFPGDATSPFPGDSAVARPDTSSSRSKSGNKKLLPEKNESACVAEFKKQITFVHLQCNDDVTQGTLIARAREIVSRHKNSSSLMMMIINRCKYASDGPKSCNQLRTIYKYDRHTIDDISNYAMENRKDPGSFEKSYYNKLDLRLSLQDKRKSITLDRVLFLEEADYKSVLKTKIMQLIKDHKSVDVNTEEYSIDRDAAAFRAVVDGNETYTRFSLADIAARFPLPTERREILRKAFPFATLSMN